MTGIAPNLSAAPGYSAIDSTAEFDTRTSGFRGELLAHCYRMLGSFDDAEDAVQDTFAKAWNGRATFRHGDSVRPWLYRIATNACLDQLDRRRRELGGGEVAVEPIPEDLLDLHNPSPEARFDARESISLAFLTAMQLLTPRQRAVLILRDVLAWRANEVAELLGMSVPAANSSLNRARVVLARRYAPRAGNPLPGRVRSLLDRYVRAWESADISGLVALLHEDAIVTMPPGIVIVGREAIAAFLASSVFDDGRTVRLQPVESNAGAAYLLSSRRGVDPDFAPYCVLVTGIDSATSTVSELAVYTAWATVERFAGISRRSS